MMQSSQRSTPGRTPSQDSRKVMEMDNEILITAAFLGAGLLAYVIIPGMLVIWDRVLDHMEHSGPEEQKKQ